MGCSSRATWPYGWLKQRPGALPKRVIFFGVGILGQGRPGVLVHEGFGFGLDLLRVQFDRFCVEEFVRRKTMVLVWIRTWSILKV